MTSGVTQTAAMMRIVGWFTLLVVPLGLVAYPAVSGRRGS